MSHIMGRMNFISGRLNLHQESGEPQAMEREPGKRRRPAAEKPAPPRMLAVAPVKMIVPRPRATIGRDASRPIRKPEKAAISQTLR